jgi:Sulfotransferase family
MVPDCEFWREVRARLEAEGITRDETCRMVDKGAAGLWRVWRVGRADPVMARRVQITQALARAITTTAGKPRLIDSGKTPTHSLLLLRHLPDARVIHLVRDPRRILQSHVWRVRTGSHLSPRLHRLAFRSVSPAACAALRDRLVTHSVGANARARSRFG